MRGKWILFAGITVLLAVAAGAISVYRQSVSQRSAAAKKSAPAPVAATAATAADVSLMGQVQAQKVVSVAAPVDGTVESFGAEIGQDVVEGQLLAHIRNTRLDSAVEGANLEVERIQAREHELEAAIVSGRLEVSRAGADLSRSRTEFDRAGKAYKRQQMLLHEGATPRLVFEKAEREYKSAKEDIDIKERLAQQATERVDALNRELDSTKRSLDEREQALEHARAEAAQSDVRAPIDGIVISRRGQPGDEVLRTMDDLFRIASMLSALEVAVQPEPSLVPRIKPGQPAAVHIAEVPDEITGTVREIRDGRVIVDFTSPTPAIRPGVTAQVLIKLG